MNLSSLLYRCVSTQPRHRRAVSNLILTLAALAAMPGHPFGVRAWDTGDEPNPYGRRPPDLHWGDRGVLATSDFQDSTGRAGLLTRGWLQGGHRLPDSGLLASVPGRGQTEQWFVRFHFP